MADIFQAWLLQGLSKPGKSQSGLARHMGVSQSAANRWANGKTRLKAEDLARIAEYIEEPVPGVVTESVRTTEISGEPSAHRAIAEIPVEGFALEGIWTEDAGMHTAKTIPILQSEDHPRAALYAVETSVLPTDDPEIAHKTFICVRFDAVGRVLRPRDRVHLERRTESGTSATIRHVVRVGNTLALAASRASQADVIPLDVSQVRGIVLGMHTMFKV